MTSPRQLVKSKGAVQLIHKCDSENPQNSPLQLPRGGGMKREVWSVKRCCLDNGFRLRYRFRLIIILHWLSPIIIRDSAKLKYMLRSALAALIILHSTFFILHFPTPSASYTLLWWVPRVRGV